MIIIVIITNRGYAIQKLYGQQPCFNCRNYSASITEKNKSLTDFSIYVIIFQMHIFTIDSHFFKCQMIHVGNIFIAFFRTFKGSKSFLRFVLLKCFCSYIACIFVFWKFLPRHFVVMFFCWGVWFISSWHCLWCEKTQCSLHCLYSLCRCGVLLI